MQNRHNLGSCGNKNQKDILKAVVSKYLLLKVVHDDGRQQCERYDLTIESFYPCDCKTYQECFKYFDFQFLNYILLRNLHMELYRYQTSNYFDFNEGGFLN